MSRRSGALQTGFKTHSRRAGPARILPANRVLKPLLHVLGGSAFALGLLAWSFSPAIARADAVPATRPLDAVAATQPAEALPATQPMIDPGIEALVDKLGDPDPAVRDDATNKLREIGKRAIPALREVAEGPDPEASSRARELIHHVQRRVPPAAPPANGMHAQSMRMSMNNGLRTMEINDNGQQIHIVTQQDGSIEMSVTGVDEKGRNSTEIYKAKDADELKRDNPEAFALYDRWSGDHAGPGGIRMHVFGQVGGAIGPGVGVMPPLRTRVEQQLREANVPPEQRDRILKQLDAADARRQEAAEQRVHDHLRGHGDAEHPQTQPGQ